MLPSSASHDMQQHQMRSLALDRRKQINTLLIFNDNVSEVSPNQRYRVDFQAGATPLVMIIDLPPKFPAHGTRPSIRVEPASPAAALRHPWLDQAGNVVGAPGLLSYGPHSDLGRVVQAIKRALEKDPPLYDAQPAPAHTSYTQSSYTQSYPFFHQQQQQPAYMAYNPAPYQHLPQQQPHQPPPPVSTIQKPVMSELQDLSLSDLEEMNRDPRAVRSFLKTLPNPGMDSVDSRVSEARDSVTKVLEDNRALVCRVEEKRGQVARLAASHGALCQSVAGLEARVEAARARNTMASIGGALKAKSTAEEEASEECAEKYLKGEVPTDEFLSEYLRLRASHHRTKAKMDDVIQTNRQLQQFGGAGGTWRH